MLRSLEAIKRLKAGDMSGLKDEKWLMYLALTPERNVNLERLTSMEEIKHNYVLNYVEKTLQCLEGIRSNTAGLRIREAKVSGSYKLEQKISVTDTSGSRIQEQNTSETDTAGKNDTGTGTLKLDVPWMDIPELNETELHILEETLKWSETAKAGLPHQRKQWMAKGFNLFVHNIGSAQIYSEHVLDINDTPGAV